MPVIGVCNQKGGSGKSSTAVHLARWLQSQSDSVFVIDSDGQRTSSLWLSNLSQPIPVEIIPDPNELLERLPNLATEHQWLIVDAPGTLAEATRAIVLWSVRNAPSANTASSARQRHDYTKNSSTCRWN